jgi:hypothetical protein
MSPRALLRLLPLLWIVAAAAGASELGVYVDEAGRTVITDDPTRLPEGARPTAADDLEALGVLWDGGALGVPLVPEPGATSSEADRLRRILHGALDDLDRGETHRAESALREVLRRDPSRPEAHWGLALLEGRRGHLDAAEDHLRSFLASAGPSLDAWRASAEERLARLEDERALLETPEAGPIRMVDLAHPAFRIRADEALVRAGGGDFADTVARYLDDASRALTTWLGVRPSEPLGVLLYGRASYRRVHGPRFSFRTVGFFDGRIHVVSAAHPAGELRALLFHEYAHALFRERTGSDRPFWLNEGLAEVAERRALGRRLLSRDERRALGEAAAGDGWLALQRLAPSFAGLDDGEARLAYRIATAAAAWIDARTDAPARAALLEQLGAGTPVDEALRGAVGVGTAGLDAALRAELAGRRLTPGAAHGVPAAGGGEPAP